MKLSGGTHLPDAGIGNMSTDTKLLRCEECAAWINLDFKQDAVSTHSGREGTENDPRAPGDSDDICDVCTSMAATCTTSLTTLLNLKRRR